MIKSIGWCASILVMVYILYGLGALFAKHVHGGERYQISEPYDYSSRRNVRIINDGSQAVITNPMNSADRQIINIRRQQTYTPRPMHEPINPRPQRNR